MSTYQSAQRSEENLEASSIVRSFLVKGLVGIAFTAAIMLVAAGRLDWWMGWAYIAAYVLVTVVAARVADPGLLAERLKRRHQDQKGWDRILLGIYGTLTALAIPLVAALDVRFGWLPDVPRGVSWIALVVYVLGWGVHIWAVAANKYHSSVVRIQHDRGQTVATGGPYRYVRHPGYVGGIALTASAPLL